MSKFLDSNGLSYLWSQIKDKLSGKVDKVSGKGLSTNDYTTTEKNKLAGIATGANKTTVDSVLSTTSTNPVQNKVVNTALNNKVDKENGKSLVSDTEITRLSTVENYDDTAIKAEIANKVDNDIFVAENLIKYPYESEQGKVGRGVTFTYDDEGVVHLVNTGTSTGDAFALVSGLTLSGTYTISVDNTDAYIRVLGIDESGGAHLIGTVINGEPTTFTIGSENGNVYPSYKVVVRVILDKVYDTYFKPMLEVGSVAHAYQPYKLSRKAMRDDINALMARLT